MRELDMLMDDLEATANREPMPLGDGSSHMSEEGKQVLQTAGLYVGIAAASYLSIKLIDSLFFSKDEEESEKKPQATAVVVKQQAAPANGQNAQQQQQPAVNNAATTAPGKNNNNPSQAQQ